MWAHRHRALVLLGSLAIVAFSAAGIRRLAFDTNLLSLLPRDGRVIPAFRTFIDRFGSLDDVYIVFTAPAGYSIADYDAEVSAWVERLRSAPEIARVDAGFADSPRDWTWLADRQLLLLNDRALDGALARFHGDGMREAVASRRELLAVPSADVTNLVRHDPLGLLDLLRDALGRLRLEAVSGFGGEGYVTADGRSKLVIAQPLRPPFEAEFSRALMARLDALRSAPSTAAADAGGGETRPPLAIEFAGGHRIAVETEALVRRESILNTAGALALILPLLFLVFRSPWLVAVGPLPSAASLVVVLGILGALGASLSAAATASAAMLFGLGVDGVVLLYVSHTRALSEESDPARAIGALGAPASSMLLGMFTTAATFYGLVAVDFPSLEQLGTLIGHSMVLCGVFTLLIVPALLPRVRRRPPRALRMPRLAAWIARRRRVVLGAALMVTLGLGFASTELRVNPSLDRLRAVTPGAQLLERIGPAFGLPHDAYVVVATGADLQELLSANERLLSSLASRLPSVAVQGPSTLLPSDAAQRNRAETVRQSGLSAGGVSTALAEAARSEGFREGTFDPFRERLPRLLDTERRLTYEGYKAHGMADVIDRLIARTPDGWVLATYVLPADDGDVPAAEAIVGETDPAMTMTGLPLVNRELADRFLPQFLRGLAIGTSIVLGLVFAAFRDLRLSLFSLLPTAIGLVWAAGGLALAGVELDLFAVFAVVTFVGIGVDYGIHLVHRYRERGHASRAVEELAPVILVAAAITLLGYGTLIWSSYPPLRSIGVVSAVSVVALAGASLLVLPALLAARSPNHAS
jgi:hypothetical protein